MYNHYMEEKAAGEKQLVFWNRRFTMVSVLRLIFFLAAVVLIYLGISDHSIPYGGMGGLSILIFVLLVRYHSSIQEKISDAKAKVAVLDRCLKRFTGEWNTFSDDGSEFLLAKETLPKDIDLLGENSLYQFLCTAHTYEGRKRLADTLCLKNTDLSSLEERKEAIRELSEKPDFSVEFEAAAYRMVMGKKKKERNVISNENAFQKFPSWMRVLMVLIPLLNLVWLGLAFAGILQYRYLLFSFLIYLFLTWFTHEMTDRIISPVHRFGSQAEAYHRLILLITKEEWKSPLLSAVQSVLGGKDGALKGLRTLATLNQAYYISYNPLLHMLLNGFLGWDYSIAYFAWRWEKHYRGNVETCFDQIAEVEELISLSVLSLVRTTGEAVVRTEKKAGKIICRDMYHPLLDSKTVVSNTVTITPGVTVITGSNMSGKTTFLRTLAINMVLAYTGAGVCASHFETGYMRIFTSMRVTDDISGGISTFYAEILRIKDMADYMKQSGNDLPAVCLIDEIFKGTNSADRIVGAQNAIRKLSAGNGMVLVSTHDFELCDLKDEAGNPVTNYHFEEHYKEDKLMFDYKIKEGRCTTRNAMAILKMAGLSD